MTGVVTRLAEAGLVERRADPADGRVTIVAVTPAGQRYLLDARTTSIAILAEHIRCLSPRQQRVLLTAVDALDALGTTTTSTGARPA